MTHDDDTPLSPERHIIAMHERTIGDLKEKLARCQDRIFGLETALFDEDDWRYRLTNEACGLAFDYGAYLVTSTNELGVAVDLLQGATAFGHQACGMALEHGRLQEETRDADADYAQIRKLQNARLAEARDVYAQRDEWYAEYAALAFDRVPALEAAVKKAGLREHSLLSQAAESEARCARLEDVLKVCWPKDTAALRDEFALVDEALGLRARCARLEGALRKVKIHAEDYCAGECSDQGVCWLRVREAVADALADPPRAPSPAEFGVALHSEGSPKLSPNSDAPAEEPECPHGSDSAFCDSCLYQRQKDQGAERDQLRARVAELERERDAMQRARDDARREVDIQRARAQLAEGIAGELEQRRKHVEGQQDELLRRYVDRAEAAEKERDAAKAYAALLEEKDTEALEAKLAESVREAEAASLRADEALRAAAAMRADLEWLIVHGGECSKCDLFNDHAPGCPLSSTAGRGFASPEVVARVRAALADVRECLEQNEDPDTAALRLLDAALALLAPAEPKPEGA